jgi:hypothetical protein
MLAGETCAMSQQLILAQARHSKLYLPVIIRQFTTQIRQCSPAPRHRLGGPMIEQRKPCQTQQ